MRNRLQGRDVVRVVVDRSHALYFCGGCDTCDSASAARRGPLAAGAVMSWRET